MGGLLRSGRLRHAFLGGVVVLLLGAMSLVAIGWVRVKMLPFDNKSEFQVVVDLPEGTTLEDTDRATRAIADAIARQPEVTSYQTYVGTSGPYNFNGLVRHYFLRRGANVADIQVNLVDKGDRSAQSHAIATRVRAAIAPVAARYHARIKVAEVPPGPPVLETLVAEIYGPSYPRQIEIARQVKGLMERTPGVVDVDWYVEDPQPKYRFTIDRVKAAQDGVSERDLVRDPGAGHRRRGPGPAPRRARAGRRVDRGGARPVRPAPTSIACSASRSPARAATWSASASSSTPSWSPRTGPSTTRT